MSNLYADVERPWTGRLVSYLDQRADVLVAIWMVILFIRLVKLLVDLGAVQRLRYYRTRAVDESWRQRVEELARRMGIKRAVELLESSLVRVPMMAGVFKPVILVPLGLLAQLPPQQVEAVLLHELAHIRRKDYFVNLLQSIAETLFFFNPAILWISSLIRVERENCCDDIAVEESRSKKEFIHALVSFQEYQQSSSYTLAFAGGKNHLLDFGDTAHSSIISLAKPKWPISFDTDEDLGEQSRVDMLAKLAKSQETIFAPHFPFPGVGKIEPQGDHFVWKPTLSAN